MVYVGPSVRLVGGRQCKELKTSEPFHLWLVHRNSNLAGISYCSDPNYL